MHAANLQLKMIMDNNFLTHKLTSSWEIVNFFLLGYIEKY